MGFGFSVVPTTVIYPSSTQPVWNYQYICLSLLLFEYPLPNSCCNLITFATALKGGILMAGYGGRQL
jgi:hypothetical protein